MGSEQLSRSPEIQDKIDTIRQIQQLDPHELEQDPTSTIEPKMRQKRKTAEQLAIDKKMNQEKKEKAQLLRMEILLNNAALMQLTLEKLEQNPTTTKDELLEYIQKSGKVVHPETTNKYIDALIEARDSLVWVFENIATEDASEMGKEIYRAMLPISLQTLDTDLPEYYVRVTRKYPLALSVEVATEDFEHIDSRRNIGGFYNRQLILSAVHADTSTKETRVVPTIVIRDYGNIRITGHEQGHAENDVFKIALLAVQAYHNGKLSKVWGGTSVEDIVNNALPNVVRALDEGTFSEDLEEVEFIIEQALALAKDELLAEMKPKEGDATWHFTNLLNDNGLYTYLSSHFHIEKNSVTYQRLWEIYKLRLQDYTKDALILYRTYKKDSRMEKRQELFRNVLAQIPLEEWNKQLEATTFMEEDMELYIISGVATMYEDELTPLISNSLPPKEKAFVEHMQQLITQVNMYVTNNSDKPMLEELRTYREKIIDLHREIERTSFHKAYIEIRAFNITKDEISHLLPNPSKNRTSAAISDALEEIAELERDMYSGIALGTTELVEFIHSYKEDIDEIKDRLTKD